MGEPAARIGDNIMCSLQTPTPAGPVPHAVPPGMPIIPPGALTVYIGGQPAARIGDKSMCITPAGPIPNPIIKGAFPVRIGGSPAARVTDAAAHPGAKIAPPCCLKVLIGLAGISGNRWAGEKACQDLKSGRNPSPTDGFQDTNYQSYNNCGVESSRGIINQATGAGVGQEALLNQAMNNGLAHRGATMLASGGTLPAGQAAILAGNGVPSTLIQGNMSAIQTAVGQGRGVIAAVDAGSPGFWPNSPPAGSGHAVTVTGVEYDEHGNIKNVIINDTSAGCNRPIPYAVFQQAMDAWNQQTQPWAGQQGIGQLASTVNPIW